MTEEEEYRIAERLATFMDMDLVEVSVPGRSRTDFRFFPRKESRKEPRQIPTWLTGRFSWEELDLRLFAMGF